MGLSAVESEKFLPESVAPSADTKSPTKNRFPYILFTRPPTLPLCLPGSTDLFLPAYLPSLVGKLMFISSVLSVIFKTSDCLF